MPTVFVSANDTGAGKTWVTATLARRLAARGEIVRVVKPVETGVGPGDPGDTGFVLDALQSEVTLLGKVSARVLRRYTRPLAPVEAARLDGAPFSFDELAAETRAQTKVGWLVVEGAGGLAVPLEDGASPRDWGDFARAIRADRVVLVVEDRLGAINQARLLAAYAKARGLNAGWWLNQVDVGADPGARATNEQTLARLGFPLWAAQDHGALSPRCLEAGWLA